jgi:NitT/TauT family transport system substrate-binding protein
MGTMRQTKTMACAVAAVALAAWPLRPAAAQDIPAKPEPGAFKMGILPWLGYGQWFVAAEKDLFAAEGLGEVEIVNFTQDKDINAALASGALDGANIATHTALIMAQAGLPIRIVALLDVSMTADAIIAGPEIAGIADLRGKEVAYEEGTTSHILLNYALAANGMTLADITPVPMPAADAGAALIAKRVPVAVTYEPYLTLARNEDPGVTLLYAASEDPGLVSDVFVVRDDVLTERPGQVLALLKAWDAALAAYNADTPDGRAIISQAVGASPEELATAFDGVTYYSMAENREELTGDFAAKVMADVEAASIAAGLLPGDIDGPALIDPRFVDATK